MSNALRSHCLGLLLLALSQHAAHAQEAAPEREAEAKAAEGDTAAVIAARARIEKGKGLYEDRHYDASLAELEEVYRLMAQHPVRFDALYNIALAYEHWHRYERAIEYFARYVEEAGEHAPARGDAEQKIAALKQLLATLAIEVNVPCDVWVNGFAIGRAPGVFEVSSGVLSVELRAAGYESYATNVQIESRALRVVQANLEQLSNVSGSSPTLFWASTAVAGAALATGVVLGALALSKNAEVGEKLDDDVEQWRVGQADEDTSHGLALGADIAFGASALFATTSIVLYFLTDWEERPDELRVSGQADARSGAIVLTGAF